jgi:membrane peptidoglycan carboxypeptidase
MPTVEETMLLTSTQKEILLTIEDPTFYKHIGIDISEGQGLTTISSSLAKTIFLSGSDLSGVKGGFQSVYRGVFNCCKKIDFGRDIMAIILNQQISKDHQLQLYISTVYLGSYKGQQIIGFNRAAKSYFNKSLTELSDDEFISLVARLKAPDYYHPVSGPEPLADRVLKIKEVLSGNCKPDGWFDTQYAHCGGNA